MRRTPLLVLACVGCSDPTAASLARAALATGWLKIDDIRPQNDNSQATSAQPVGAYDGMAASLPGDNYVYYFGGDFNSDLFHQAQSQGTRLAADGSFLTDATAPYLDIPPLGNNAGRQLFALFPVYDGTAYTSFLALGGQSKHASGPANLSDAWKFTLGSGWTPLGELPIPSNEVDPVQPDGSQAFVDTLSTYDARHGLAAGGLLGNPAHPTALPSTLLPSSLSSYTILTPNAVFYVAATGRFYDVPMVADTVAGYGYKAGRNTQCINLPDGRDVCCFGRQVRGDLVAFPYAHNCQIFTPDYAAPAASRWTECQDFQGVDGEDFNNPRCCATAGCVNPPQCADPTNGNTEIGLAVASNGHVLVVGGWIRGADNHSAFPRRSIVDFDPERCTDGAAYTVVGSLLLARTYPKVVAVPGATDTFLVIGGKGDDGDHYTTERVIYTPARGSTPPSARAQFDAPLPSWTNSDGRSYPFAGAWFGSAAGVLGNGAIWYAGGPDVSAGNCVAGAHCVLMGSAAQFALLPGAAN
jgi:hypothetical protein